MIDLFGYVAQFLFILASAAQATKSMRDGHSEGVSHGLIWMLTIGFTLMIIYVVQKIGIDIVLLSGYTGQAIFCLIIGKYKYFPTKTNKDDDLDDCVFTTLKPGIYEINGSFATTNGDRFDIKIPYSTEYENPINKIYYDEENNELFLSMLSQEQMHDTNTNYIYVGEL